MSPIPVFATSQEQKKTVVLVITPLVAWFVVPITMLWAASCLLSPLLIATVLERGPANWWLLPLWYLAGYLCYKIWWWTDRVIGDSSYMLVCGVVGMVLITGGFWLLR